MKTTLLALLLLLPQFADAGGAPAVIAVGYSPNAPAVRLQVAADYVAVPLTVSNDAKDPAKRSDEIEKALHAITDKLKLLPDFKVRPGVVSLSPQERSGLSKFSSSDSHAGSTAQLYILGSLKPETTVFELSKRLHQLINSVPFADGTRVTLGNTVLGVEDPERYRSQLLGLIARSVEATKKALGMLNGSIELDGLESAVAVMQMTEREVIVFLNYRLQVQTEP